MSILNKKDKEKNWEFLSQIKFPVSEKTILFGAIPAALVTAPATFIIAGTKIADPTNPLSVYLSLGAFAAHVAAVAIFSYAQNKYIDIQAEKQRWGLYKK
ncbi:MAG: hypothetical protein IKQ31_02050 [Clostridia bacterium]|nr:hypothetical protein [Clostridia bacterium]